MRKLTKAQAEELHHIANSRPYNPSVGLSAKRPQVAAALARMGLVTQHEQSEQVRGERRAYWFVYKITPAGRTALSSLKGGE